MDTCYNTRMKIKKLTKKVDNFSAGNKIFFKDNNTWELSESETLPSGFLFGVDLPRESGYYYTESTLGSFVFRVENGLPISWASNTGSHTNGNYTYNNTVETPGTPTLVFSDSTLTFESYYDFLVDFGDFLLYGPVTGDTAVPTLNYGVLKLDRDFNVISKIYDTTSNFVYSFINACSVDLGGIVFLGYNGVGDEVQFHFMDPYTEQITVQPVPNADDGAYSLVGIGNGEFYIDGTNNSSVYKVEDGIISPLEENVVWTSTPGSNDILWGYHYYFNCRNDDETIYIVETHRIRAIDRKTYQFRWEKSINTTHTNNSTGTGAILSNGNIVYAYEDVTTGKVDEFDKTTGTIVNTIDAPLVWTPSIWGQGEHIYIRDDAQNVFSYPDLTLHGNDASFNLTAYAPVFMDKDGNTYIPTYDDKVLINNILYDATDIDTFSSPMIFFIDNRVVYIDTVNSGLYSL